MDRVRLQINLVFAVAVLVTGLLGLWSLKQVQDKGRQRLAALSSEVSQAGQERDAVRSSARLLESLHGVAGNLASSISDREGKLLALAGSGEIHQILAGVPAASVLKWDPHFWADGLLLVGPDGRMMAHWPETSGSHASSRAFQTLKTLGDSAGQVFVDGVEEDASGHPALVLVAGVPGSKGKGLAGMVQASIGLSKLVSGSSDAVQQAAVFLFQGSKAAFVNGPQAAGFPDPALVEKMAGQEGGWVFTRLGGRDGLAAWARIFPWEPSQGRDSLEVVGTFAPFASPAVLPEREGGWGPFLPVLAGTLVLLAAGWAVLWKVKAPASGIPVPLAPVAAPEVPQVPVPVSDPVLIGQVQAARARQKALEEETAALRQNLEQSQKKASELALEAGQWRADLEAARRAAEDAIQARESLQAAQAGPAQPPAVFAEVQHTDPLAQARREAFQALSSELKATLGAVREQLVAASVPQEFMGRIINRSARLERQSNDLQELTALQAGQVLVKAPADLAALVEAQSQAVSPQAEIRQVSLRVSAQPGLPSAEVDSGKVSSMINALLAQAVRVTPPEGSVSVTLVREEGQVKVRVADGGQALTQEQASQVWSEFHGPDSPSGPEFAGTGLRFPLIRVVMESLGGSAELALSDEGKTFVLGFRAAAGPAPSIPAASIESPGLPPLPPLGGESSLPPLPELGSEPAAPPEPPGPQASGLQTLDDLTSLIQSEPDKPQA
jgi:signal transduction histidine kinase